MLWKYIYQLGLISAWGFIFYPLSRELLQDHMEGPHDLETKYL